MTPEDASTANPAGRPVAVKATGDRVAEMRYSKAPPYTPDTGADPTVMTGYCGLVSTTSRSSAATEFGLPAESRNLDAATDTRPGSAEFSEGVNVPRYSVAEIAEKPLIPPPVTVMAPIAKSGEASLKVNVTTLVCPCSKVVRSAVISTVGAEKSVRNLPCGLAAEEIGRAHV